MSVQKINLRVLQATMTALQLSDVRYHLGAKAQKLNVPPSAIRAIDCSGLIRYLVYRATDPALTIPDGSWKQREWAEDHLQKIQYGMISRPSEGQVKLYLATLDPNNGHAGHIWFVRTDPPHDPFTFESHGGRGPNSRPWNTPILRTEVDHCFLWPHTWE